MRATTAVASGELSLQGGQTHSSQLPPLTTNRGHQGLTDVALRAEDPADAAFSAAHSDKPATIPDGPLPSMGSNGAPALPHVEQQGDSSKEWVRPPPWLTALGLGDRTGIGRIAAELRAATVADPGNVSVFLGWPSPPPSAMLAWATEHLGCGLLDSKPIRALFVGGGRADMRLLTSALVDREQTRPLWIPHVLLEMNPMRDAMACAFLLGRLKPGAPARLPVSSLVPILHSQADAERPWAQEWKGFMGDAHNTLRADRGGMFGYRWHRYGRADSTRPFGFVLPRTSVGSRRTRDVETAPGGFDLVVADFSAQWMSPSRVGDEVGNLVLDVVAATRKVPPPRFLILVSDPRALLAVLGKVKELRDNDILSGSRTVSHVHYVGDREGRIVRAAQGWPGHLEVHAASTTEADVQHDLTELARRIEATHPRSADALVQAARELAKMACSIAPPLAGGAEAETTWTFVDAARVVREALREEGAPAEEAAIEDVLRRGREAATNLMRRSPAYLAFEEAVAATRDGLKVTFVAESALEAKEALARAPEGMLVTSRRCSGMEIAAHTPELVVTACRGHDAVRLLAEIPLPPKKAILLLPPLEASVAARIAQLVLEHQVFSSVHPLCRKLLAAMPPSFARLSGASDIYLRRAPRRQVDAASTSKSHSGLRDSILLCTEDGEQVEFAKGSTVVTLAGGRPIACHASDLEPGDVVVVLPEDVGDRIARELGWNGEAAMMDEQVARYKQHVQGWRAGAGAGLSPRQVIQRMQAVDPGMLAPSESTIRYWLAGGDAQKVAAPHASGDPRWLAAFLRTIDLADADGLFVHFGQYRGRLKRGGHLRSGLLERFLFDKYDAVVQRGVSHARATELREIALRHTREIIAIERREAVEDEA